MDPSEIDLIQAAQRGDVAAFEKLMREHDRGILKLALLLLQNHQDAQDVYQEVFLKSFDHIKYFRFESSYNTYLTRITINLCRNRIRQRRIRQWLSLDDEGEGRGSPAESLISDETAPDEQVQKLELWQQIQGVLQNMPLKQRTAFTLKHIYGYSIKEIAEIERCAEGTVKNHIFRAVQKLKRQLQPYFP
ncbi:RNA polymerase sigma factor [candidate division KSB1 bacterium]|nr:RNA polymerase sigma factor [candidate division KSB1 bacterium]